MQRFTTHTLANGRVVAVLTLFDPTHLLPLNRYYGERVMSYHQALQVAVEDMRRLETPPDVVVCVISGE